MLVENLSETPSQLLGSVLRRVSIIHKGIHPPPGKNGPQVGWFGVCCFGIVINSGFLPRVPGHASRSFEVFEVDVVAYLQRLLDKEGWKWARMRIYIMRLYDFKQLCITSYICCLVDWRFFASCCFLHFLLFVCIYCHIYIYI